ncbi:MAG TPA: NAD(P)/FAD-dependent oxidoreductase [Myxococcota bacterium]|nr:NAD(P)/FAD-dependent oxidoreductase [Myxococcota bacterium]
MPGLTASFEIPRRTADMLIVGLGPAGVACALQGVRDGLDVLAVSDEPVGGLVRAARRLDNLPGEPGISGAALAEKLTAQLSMSALAVVVSRVTELRREGDFVAELADGHSLRARSVVLATGTRPSEWNHGHGPHRDARTLPSDLSDRDVAVIGGGEAALDTALTCRDRGARVAVLVRGAQPRSAERLVEEALGAGVEIHSNTLLQEITGHPGAYLLVCSAGQTLEAHEMVVCIGRIPRDELAGGLLPGGLPPGAIRTVCPGLLLAGDLVRGRERYVATAMGDGQRAALEAYRFCKEEKR